MTRFNTRGQTSKPAVATVSSPMSTISNKAPDTRTYNGGVAWQKTPQTELFLLASGSFLSGSDTFYESGNKRDERLRQLARQVAVEDFDWFVAFVSWLRREGNIRTAAIMIAADGVKARLDAGLVVGGEISNRSVIDSVLLRPDEPGEMLAYWTSAYGRKIPKPVKRGIADAVRRLYNERALLKYDTASKGFRFGDVLNLVHAEPDPAKPWQGALFKYALDRRHNPDAAIPGEALRTVQANATFRERVKSAPYLAYTPEALSEAAMTWEDALSLSGQLGLDKQKVWESIIPSMGAMALVRNLRNFDEAGVSDKVASQVAMKISDPDEVLRSRQFPFRYLAAYQHAPSLRWSYPLEQALGHSLANVPSLPGRTLILVDRSGSMFWSGMSDKSKLTFADSAAIFGTALAVRAQNADLVEFGTGHKRVSYAKGESVLKILGRFTSLGGTNTVEAVRANYSGHDRVVIVTDEQYTGSGYGYVGDQVPAHIPMYTWNLNGYSGSQTPSGAEARFLFGGLTDKAFTLIPLLEAGKNGTWPWEMDKSE